MKVKDQKKEKSWWSNLSLELITKSSLNFLRDLHGLPRVRFEQIFEFRYENYHFN